MTQKSPELINFLKSKLSKVPDHAYSGDAELQLPIRKRQYHKVALLMGCAKNQILNELIAHFEKNDVSQPDSQDSLTESELRDISNKIATRHCDKISEDGKIEFEDCLPESLANRIFNSFKRYLLSQPDSINKENNMNDAGRNLLDLVNELIPDQTKSYKLKKAIADAMLVAKAQPDCRDAAISQMREALKPFANAWEFTERDRINYSGRSGDYPVTEDYILEVHFKSAYEALALPHAGRFEKIMRVVEAARKLVAKWEKHPDVGNTVSYRTLKQPLSDLESEGV